MNSGWAAFDDVTLVAHGEATKYYYAGQRIAMRKAGVVYYLHGDHLGSTSLTTCGSTGGCGGVAYGAEVAR